MKKNIKSMEIPCNLHVSKDELKTLLGKYSDEAIDMLERVGYFQSNIITEDIEDTNENEAEYQ